MSKMKKQNIIKNTLKKLFSLLGIDIRLKKKHGQSEFAWLRNYNINTVIDIGANRGDFSRTILKIFPDSSVIAFEPLKKIYHEMSKSMENVQNLKIFNCAVGDKNCKPFIYHNEFSPSSSILELEDLHLNAFPFAVNTRKEKIEIRRLDDVLANIKMKKDILIKIDVQGFEDRVIKGGERTISESKILIVETNFFPLFKNQVIFDGIYNHLTNLGFSYIGNMKQSINPLNGIILWADSIFIKK